MGPLPDTVDAVELTWTTLAVVATAMSLLVWGWARKDLRGVWRVGRFDLAEFFLEDLRNARWRALTAAGLVVVGAIALAHPSPPVARPLSGWVAIVLFHLVPVQIIVRCDSERRTRAAALRRMEATASDPGETGRNEGPSGRSGPSRRSGGR